MPLATGKHLGDLVEGGERVRVARFRGVSVGERHRLLLVATDAQDGSDRVGAVRREPRCGGAEHGGVELLLDLGGAGSHEIFDLSESIFDFPLCGLHNVYLVIQRELEKIRFD